MNLESYKEFVGGVGSTDGKSREPSILSSRDRM